MLYWPVPIYNAEMTSFYHLYLYLLSVYYKQKQAS